MFQIEVESVEVLVTVDVAEDYRIEVEVGGASVFLTHTQAESLAQALRDEVDRANRALAEDFEVAPMPVHAAPLPGRYQALCCGRPVFELPRGERITNVQAMVTCPVRRFGFDQDGDWSVL